LGLSPKKGTIKESVFTFHRLQYYTNRGILWGLAIAEWHILVALMSDVDVEKTD